jgi:hypothetical protein
VCILSSSSALARPCGWALWRLRMRERDASGTDDKGQDARGDLPSRKMGNGIIP